MKATISTDGAERRLAIHIPGDLTSTTVPAMLGDLDAVLAPGAAPSGWEVLRLDLAAAKRVDSVGLNLVVTLLRSVKNTGGRMQLIYGNSNVHRTLLFTRLDRHLELIEA